MTTQTRADALARFNAEDAKKVESTLAYSQFLISAPDILKLANHQAAVIEAMREALKGLTDDIKSRAEWDGTCKVVCCGNGVWNAAIGAITLADAPYEVSK